MRSYISAIIILAISASTLNSCKTSPQGNEFGRMVPYHLSRPTDSIATFFNHVDSLVKPIAGEHKQLADWNKEKETTGWRAPGKRTAFNHLYYAHAISKRKPTDDSRKLYNRTGCTITIHVYTSQTYELTNSTADYQIFGERMGSYYVLASVITEKPQKHSLEGEIIGLIRKAMVLAVN